ncbi:hypothetical protein MYX75_13175 [Acidobacteria bacterium AH-259-A15]|nr:hypothetical protein [Acidobacteria bacterium AH-259-A15]
MKCSNTEYLIHYPIGEDGMYFRGYPIKIGDVSCVQVEVLGNEDGPLDGDEKDLFHVVSYQLEKSELTIKTLNTDLVDDELKDSEALKKAFLGHEGSKDLFTDPGKFRKIKGKS